MRVARQRPGPGDLVAAARAGGVRDQRVLDAIAQVPREKFVPAAYAGLAYADRPIPIPRGQVTSQPSLQALMVAALGLTGREKVLEVGTGYGYQTALLARLAAQVISIDVWADLTARAERNLAGQGIGNVVVITGDGTRGVPGHAPFVSAAFPAVPPPLAAQLTGGGRLVQPVGPGRDEEVVLYARAADTLTRVRTLTPASFVRLYGQHGYLPLPRTQEDNQEDNR
jgi:protein-L-isoaspartate(D-aspartate) O-methyltransferase